MKKMMMLIAAALFGAVQAWGATELIMNGGFESGCNPSTSGWLRCDKGAAADGWTLVTNSGISHSSDTTWVPSYPSGSSVVCFIQAHKNLADPGVVAQTVTIPEDDYYVLSFQYIGRYYASGSQWLYDQLLKVYFDDTVAWSGRVTSTSWSTAKAVVWLTKGTHTLKFEGTHPSDSSYDDNCSCIDNVSLKSRTLCSTWAEVKEALEGGYSVKLTEHISQDATIATLTGTQDVTLDLNGNTITQYGTSSGSLYIINCTSGSAKVTIKDSIGTGAIVGNATYKTIGGSGGGGFKFDGSSSLTLESGTLKNFRLESASSPKLNGGCIYIGASASFTMNGGMITNCTCSGTGGAVYSAGTVTMNGGTIAGCESTGHGGAIYNNSGAVSLKNGTISGCVSLGGGAGGVLFNGASNTVKIVNMKFLNNQAKSGYGGAINFGNNGGTYEMRNCTFTGNSASATGGAIIIGERVNADIYDGTITGNTADGISSQGITAAAVILNAGAGNRLRIYGAVISNNTNFAIQRSGAATIYGGVYSTNPSGVTNLAIADGYASTQVGNRYVVGKSVAFDANDQLTAGTYTFCPTNAEYVAAGVALADGKDVRSVAGSPVALHYVMDSDKSILAFDAQSGTGAEASRTITVGDKTLGGTSTTKPTRSGYLFCGYFTGTDGTGTQVFDSNGAVIGMWAPPARGITLYASWISVQGFTSMPGASGTVSSGNYYTAPNGTYNAASYKSGLYVAGNATTYLYIPAGTTFTVNGSEASGVSPGGAGINLPSTSTLVVFGGGTLKATGGKAAPGSNGKKGGSGELSVDDDSQQGGKGGAGGAGGGGAGAGIGGSGGAGGAAKEGPEGPSTSPCGTTTSCKNGNTGYTGNAGSSGGTAGVLYALGSVTISATAGGESWGGSAGSVGSTSATSEGSSWANAYTSAPGGGGGGGGSGSAAKAIGGGGGGGGSGGSGGSGATTGRKKTKGYLAPSGQGGSGGAGAYYGVHGNPTDRESVTGNGPNTDITVDGGAGGSGGAQGSTPGNGTVYKSASATVSGGSQTSATTTPSGLLRTLTLVDCGATSAGTTSQDADFQNGFNWTGDDITVPTRTGCTFAGYYTDQFGCGTQHIGADGKWTTGYGTFAARKLYAKWTAALTVAKEGEGTVMGSASVVAGSEATITAQPAVGARFLGWSDGVTNSVRTVEVASNVTYTARFVSGMPAGDNTWAYVENGVCTVYGTGATSNDKPLDAQWASITNVVITDGVTGLGTYFFHKFYNLTNVTIAASCTTLGEGALFRCLSLENVAFEGTSLPTLGENALPIRAAIKMNGDTPVVTMVPKVTVGGKDPTLQGSNDLSNWENVTSGNEKNYHFFKYVLGN